MQELLPLGAGFILVWLWPRLECTSARFILLAVLLGVVCSYVTGELAQSWTYAFLDATATYLTFLLSRLTLRRLLLKPKTV